MLKVCSFNVNGVRARPHQLEMLADTLAPDIICLQETKVMDELYPSELVQELGYEVLVNGQKAHHGVSVMYKSSPQLQLLQWHKGIPGLPDEKHPRMIRAQFQYNGTDIWLFNGYFPQGESRLHPQKFPYKQLFYQKLTEFLHENHKPTEAIAILGDINISPDDKDIGIGEANRLRWLKTGKCSFLPEERSMLAELCAFGLTDSWRWLNPESTDLYSWFDYRSRGFDDEPKRGLRIDQIWCTSPLMEALRDAGISYDCRAMEKPSDHAPIWSQFEL